MFDSYRKWDSSRPEPVPPHPPTSTPTGAIPELVKLTGDERNAKIWEMTMAGFRNAQIARMFGVSTRTISRARQAYVSLHREQGLRQDTALTMIAEEVSKLDEIERAALQEAANITSAGKRFNPRTGKTEAVEGHGDIKDKERFMKLALDAGEKRRKLLIEVGIIPRDPTRVVASLSPQENVEESAEENMTPEELKAKIVETLSRAKFIQ